MKVIYPDRFNFREPVNLTFTSSALKYSAIIDDQRILYGKMRRVLTFLISGEDYRAAINEIEHCREYFLILLPLHPIRMKVRDDTDLVGETDLVVDGNIFHRPLTLTVNYESGYPDAVVGTGGPVAIYDLNARTYTFNTISRGGSYDAGSGSFGSIGAPFNTSLIQLEDPIPGSILAKNLAILDFIYAQYIPGNQAQDITGRIGEGRVSFEEIFEGEKW